jgi:hypothetical protein
VSLGTTLTVFLFDQWGLSQLLSSTTIIGIVSVNNVSAMNLLLPNGQCGGKDHASARYIFTELARITRTIFHTADDPLPNYPREYDDDIEPEW